MDIMAWLDSRDWGAIGGVLTAAFTGFSAWWLWRNRQRPQIKVEMSALGWAVSNKASVLAEFTFMNVGTGAAYDVRMFVTKPGLPDKQQGETVASLQPGQTVELTRNHSSRAGAQEFAEESGWYPDVPLDFDPQDMGIAITWAQPPRHRRRRSLRARESELLADFRERFSPLD